MPDLDPSFDPKDALNTQDDSEVLDHSAGTQPSNYTQNFLQGREQNFGYSRSQQVRLSRNAPQQHEEAITNPDNLAKRENTAGVGLSSGGDKPDKDKLTNPMNYLNGKNGNSSRSPLSAASIKAKVRRRVIAGVVAGLLGLGGLGIGIMGPSILSGKILDVIEKRFVAPTAKTVSSHTKNLWFCKLSSSCSKAVNDAEGVTDENGDGIGQVSDNAKNSVAANGGDVTEPTDTTDGNIKLSDGAKVGTGSDGTTSINDMSPVTEEAFTSMSPATSETRGALSGEPTADMLQMTGANENIPLADDVGDKDGKGQTIQEQLDAQESGDASSSDLTVQNAETVSPGQKITFEKSGSSSSEEENSSSKGGFIESNNSSPEVEASANIESDAETKVESATDEVEKSGSNAAEDALNIACGVVTTANGATNAYRLGIKLYKIVQLSRFAYEFLTVLNSVQADDGSNLPGRDGPTSEQFSQVMSDLTTVMEKNGTVTTKSGTDSFGYQAAAGYLTTSNGGTFDLTNVSKSSDPGMPSTFTSKVMINGDSGDRSLFSMLVNAVPSVSGMTEKLLNGGCASLPLIYDGVKISQDGGVAAEALEPTGITQILAGANILSQVGSFIASVMPSGTAATAVSWGSALLGAGSSCAGVVASAGTSALSCAMNILAIGTMVAIPQVVQAVINHFTQGFLKDPMPVGADAMDAIISGAGASMGLNAALSGVPVVGKGSSTSSSDYSGYVELNNELTAYNQRQDAMERTTASPFDIYNQATFLGSIAGDFFANLYANGNQPSQMLASLFGMFGSSFANFASGTSAYAATASAAYANSCTDSDMNDAGIAADPFCNPIYGLSDSDTMSVESTIDAITSAGWGDCQKSDGTVDATISSENACTSAGESWKSAIDPTATNYDKTYGLNTDANIPVPVGKLSKTISGFISECVTRNNNATFTPMGSSTSNMGNGANCIISSSTSNDNSAYGRSNIITLYNYIEYFLANSNINQGSSLGSQADGSANAN